MRENSLVLLTTMAQTQTEQMISPTVTVLTTQWACQNRWNSERSEDVNGKADGTMSAGFMGASFRRSDRGHDRSGALAPGTNTGPAALRAPTRPEISRGPEPDPPPAGPKSSPNLSKLGRTAGRSWLTKPRCP